MRLLSICLILALASTSSAIGPIEGPADDDHLCEIKKLLACDGLQAHRVEVTVLDDPADRTASGSSTWPCGSDCPDLAVDIQRMVTHTTVSNETFAASDCNVEEGSTQPGNRTLLRFPTKISNVGEGHLTLGDPADSPAFYEWGDCHGHWHFDSFASYRLWNVSTYAKYQQLRQDDPNATFSEIMADHPELADGVVAGHKQGFCLIDVERAYIVYPTVVGQHRHCDDQGISAGWADIYDGSLDGQFVDITGVPPGAYVLEVEANPDRIIDEADTNNNAGAVIVILPQW